MRIKHPIATQKEPTIALINIVFLMLVFFMIAGTLVVPLDSDLKLIETSGLEGREPPDTLVVHADGHLSLRGAAVEDATAFLATLSQEDLEIVRIVPDRALPAKQLVALGNALRHGGAGRVMLVSEKVLQ
ncbi:biopolymer transporter ExbD [Rhodobacterales bacterium 56_14_T64]|nr:biopolymer transporter ExbD [Rhodobacterales bacterium 56_14_T64]